MTNLSDEEIEKLKLLVPHAAHLARDAEYEKSKAVVWSHWKQIVIGLAAAVAAGALLYEKIKAVGVWVFR